MAHPVVRPEHDELRGVVRRFVGEEIAPNVEHWERDGWFPDSLFERCGELGLLGLGYEQRWGGSGPDLIASLVFLEELGRCGCGGVPMAVAVQTHMATPAIASFGSDALRQHYLRPAIAGAKIAAIAITEPDAGSDVAAVRTSARQDGDTWVVNGTKTFITNGARAHFLTLVAQTGRGTGHRGISLFVVDTGWPGVSVNRTLEKLGMRSSDTAELHLEDVRVPGDHLIGTEPGLGFEQLMRQLQHERLSAASISVGQAAWVLDQTIDYARTRRTFGRPIAAHQVVAHHLADAATEIEAARALLWDTAWRVEHGDYPVAAISMTKKYAAQVLDRVADMCLQIHGGAGYLEELPIARAYRDARLWRIGAGTDEIMNEIIAKRLGLV